VTVTRVIRTRPRLIGLFALALGCQPAHDQSTRPGHLEVQWTGSSPGKIAGSATAEWCANRRLLEIRTIQGDSGIALAIYPVKALGPGRYPIVEPAKAESMPPSAGLALRWLTRTTVQGLRGDSGTVDLVRSPSGQFSGRLKARARSVVDTLRVTLTGTFQDLTIHPEPRGCTPASEPADEAAGASDTGLH
jgi:hypothetical protein